MAVARDDDKSLTDDEPHDLWDDPRDGLPPDEAPWDWDEVGRQKNGKTKNHPGRNGDWYRWYFIYHKPTCTKIKISVDQNPNGKWFNPHPSSGPI